MRAHQLWDRVRKLTHRPFGHIGSVLSLAERVVEAQQKIGLEPESVDEVKCWIDDLRLHDVMPYGTKGLRGLEMALGLREDELMDHRIPGSVRERITAINKYNLRKLQGLEVPSDPSDPSDPR